MKKRILVLLAMIFCWDVGKTQSIEKIVINGSDGISGYYLAVNPGNIKAVLILLPGFGEGPEAIFPETKLHNIAYANGILTIGFAAGNKLYADKPTQEKLTNVINDIIKRYGVDKDKFVLGGFSAGGAVALRYVELCKQYQSKFPINPKGVFLVDSPIDIFSLWDNLETSRTNKYSDVAVKEAEWVIDLIKRDHGIPEKNIDFYSELNPFSMNSKYGKNEKWLKQVAVRAYHDLDVGWRIVNRNQPVSQQNFLITSELINRLLLMGNKRAEFMGSYQTGYRSNGMRHPHSWSIVNEIECIQWIKRITE